MRERLRGHVWLVGSGPGAPGLVTAAGLAALRRAEVVVYDRLAAADLLDEAPGDAILIDAGKASGDHTMTQDEINASLVEHGLAGRRVVRLKGGDPYVFGRGGEEALALAAAGVPCSVIPGVTSAIAGAAMGGIPVTHRGIASSFAVITGHEDPTKPASAVRWERLATAVDTLVVLMGVGRLEAIAAGLISGGRSAETPAALVQQATLPGQRVLTSTLGRIAEDAREADIRAPALFVVGDVVGLQPRLDPAHLAPLAGKRVLVTRTRRQVSALVELLRLEGAHPVELPAIEIRRRADPRELERTFTRLELREYRWVIFTSANAVEAYFDLLVEWGGDARAFAGADICAIGPATARALEQRGLCADLVPADSIGEGVLEALQRHAQGAIAGHSVLLPRAEGARDVLPDGLSRAGAKVDEVTLYLSAPPADPPAGAIEEIRAAGVDVATFTSSSTVRNLAAILGGDLEPLRGAVIACIGPATAAAAREIGLEPQVVAEEHSVPGLVEALRCFLHSDPERREEA